MSDSNVSSSVPASAPSSAPAPSTAPSSPMQTTANTGTQGIANPTPAVKDPNLTPALGGARPAPSQPTPAQKQAQETARMLKLKIDGRDVDMSEPEVVKWAQMGKASDQRFQEASQMRKQAEDFMQALKTNPRAVLENPAIGVDLRKFAEDYLVEQLKNEQLSPEQRQIKELEKKIQAAEDEKRQYESQRQQQEMTRLQSHYAQEYETKIMDALSKGNVPKTPETVKRMANYMQMALSNGVDIDPANVLEMIKQDYLSDITALFSNSDGDTLLKFLGDGIANKIRKSDLARLRASQAPLFNTSSPSVTSEASAPVAKEQKGDGKLSIHEWRAQLNARTGKK